jgi:poly(A) polymerase
LEAEGFTAWFNGGCVRDRLLGKEPKDYDIATNAKPEEVEKLFPRANLIGAHFGVVLVKEPEGHFEIATFRTDHEYEDGRRPTKVTFATPEDDAQRRDFTVNGLFENPETGEVIDYVNGRADLDQQLLRAIGDPERRFAEDRLRMLRAIRFATTLGFQIDPETFAAIQTHASAIHEISVERIRDELVRTLLHPNRVRGFDLLVESGLMKGILPEILVLQGCEQPPQFHPEGDVFVHTRLMLSLLKGDDASLPLVLSVLFHDIAKPATYTYDEENERIRFNGHDRLGAEMTEVILRRLKFSNEVIEAAVEMVSRHMQFMNVKLMRTAKLKRFMSTERFTDEMELHRVDCMSSNGMLDNYDFVQEKREEFANEPLIPARLVTGRDLLEMGWKPGPEIGRVLETVQTEQLEGRLTERQAALEWVRTNVAIKVD